MIGFHEVSFPIHLALGAVGGPERRTEIVTLASGTEVRNAKWSRSRRRWDVGSAITRLADLQALLNFFEARQGRLYGFRFRDPLDHSSALPGETVSPLDQGLAIGDGEVTQFQLVKDYGGTVREIQKPIPGSVRVALDGIEQSGGWSLDATTGVVVFAQAPESGTEIRAGFEFECAARFEADQITGVIEAFGAGRIVSVTLVELL